MAMDVYDQLANAVQAVMAEKEVSEFDRGQKVRAALNRSGHNVHWDALRSALEAKPEAKPRS